MVTKSQLEEFIASPIWAELQKELKLRSEYIVSKLIQGGDDQWTDDMMRGRISELEYMEDLPNAMLADIVLAEQATEQQKNAESSNKETE